MEILKEGLIMFVVKLLKASTKTLLETTAGAHITNRIWKFNMIFWESQKMFASNLGGVFDTILVRTHEKLD